MPLPPDYPEKVYAGVLGKLIGVYLGRPFEGWTYERILAELGEIDGYVNDRVPGNPPLVVTDDDIAGTFTFLRALPDHGNSPGITPAQIGRTWLNYIVENRSTLWWGGLGNSTEHTAYLRLKNGFEAPRSGSIELNGHLMAEQIGAQIFSDGWAMVAPGDPALAADLAGRAASVSHDGEAVFAAQVLAAMEAQAFIETDIDALLDEAVSYIPKDSTTHRLIADLRSWHAGIPDWHQARAKLAGIYNYENYGGNCHVIPNHALIILGLLYGGGDFDLSMRIVNTAGWDTDCNSGNLGCLLGIRNGLAAFHSDKNWRGPVADRLFIPAGDGGGAITDAAIEAVKIINIGRALAGERPLDFKSGARFHFEFPGSVQGFANLDENTRIENVPGHSRLGTRSLAIRFEGSGRIASPTFILPEELDMPGYGLLASPTLYPGQRVRAGLRADAPVEVGLFIEVYDADDHLTHLPGPSEALQPGRDIQLAWTVPDTGGQPIARVGLACRGHGGTVYLDSLAWDGEPAVTFKRPAEHRGPAARPLAWRRAWVDAVDGWDNWFPTPFRLVQNQGRGLLVQGTREWRNYTVEADITPWLMAAGGIGARVQGLQRYYSLELKNGSRLQLVRALGDRTVLAERAFAWQVERTYNLKLSAEGDRLRAWIDGELQFDVHDPETPLDCGGVAFLIEEGHMASEAMRVQPAEIMF